MLPWQTIFDVCWAAGTFVFDGYEQVLDENTIFWKQMLPA